MVDMTAVLPQNDPDNSIRNALREKNGIMWEKFPSGGPPHQAVTGRAF